MKPPVRLLEDPSVTSELRAELERAASAEWPYDAGRGLVSLQSALGAGGAAADGASAAPAKLAVRWGSATGKVALALGGAAILAVAVFGWAGSQPRTQGPHAVPAAKQLPEATPSVPHARAPEPVRAPVIAPPTTAIPDARNPDGVRNPDGALQREIAQLGRIKQLLANGEPRRAYALARSGHREFSAGMLREEREGLAILALWELGRRDEALRRTRAFLARYPESPLRDQLAERLTPERDPHTDQP